MDHRFCCWLESKQQLNSQIPLLLLALGKATVTHPQTDQLVNGQEPLCIAGPFISRTYKALPWKGGGGRHCGQSLNPCLMKQQSTGLCPYLGCLSEAR